MGMYTQIRGWINVNSIGDYAGERRNTINQLLQEAKNSFENDETILDITGKPLARKWVCNSTIAHEGGNGSMYLFVGTELKNYGCPAEIWIKYLLKYFPNAEGRIDFQYEEDENQCKYWLIHKGEIIKEDFNDVWCEGYGNFFKITTEDKE